MDANNFRLIIIIHQSPIRHCGRPLLAQLVGPTSSCQFSVEEENRMHDSHVGRPTPASRHAFHYHLHILDPPDSDLYTGPTNLLAWTGLSLFLSWYQAPYNNWVLKASGIINLNFYDMFANCSSNQVLYFFSLRTHGEIYD
jgi:hypothetical protein